MTGTLEALRPDAQRRERLRQRCHAGLARHRRQKQPPARAESFVARIVTPSIALGAGVLYVASLIGVLWRTSRLF